MKNNEISQLNPWRVICGFLFELDSYYIPEIIDKSGLEVNWTLSERENFSHKYRKDTFRPRINDAYNLVSEENKLRVSFSVAHELTKRIDKEKLNEALNTIGWKITNEKLFPEKQEIQELFLPVNSQHDAYKEIRKIIQNTKSSINIIDPYIDSSIFTLINTISSNQLNVSLLTFKYPNDFLVEAKKYIDQYKLISLEIKKSKEFHDRFIVIDNNECWHVGCSIKDAGNKAFMISKIEDGSNKSALLQQLQKSLSSAKVVTV